MKKIIYTYEDWHVTIKADGTVVIKHNGLERERTYDLGAVTDVTTTDQYVYINLDEGNTVHLKLEYGECVVLDKWDESGTELLEEIGAWDFVNDYDDE